MTSANALPELAGAPTRERVFELKDLGVLTLRIEVPLGSVLLTLAELLEMRVGSILQLDRLTGQSLEINVNGTSIAKGEVRVHGERFAIRITEVLRATALDEIEGEEPHDATPPESR